MKTFKEFLNDESLNEDVKKFGWIWGGWDRFNRMIKSFYVRKPKARPPRVRPSKR